MVARAETAKHIDLGGYPVANWDPRTRHSRADLAGLVRGGFHSLRCVRLVSLSATHPEELVGFLRLLCEAQSVGLRVRWQGGIEGVDTSPLTHLDPPTDDHGEYVWPPARRPLLTIRHGPGFCYVEDGRTEHSSSHFIDDPEICRALRHCTVPREEHDIDSSGIRRTVGFLIDRGLIFRCGPWFLALPVRFRHGRA